jgi:hypothetical protein
MTTTVQENREQHRFEVHVDGTLAGFAAYRLADDTVTFTHTEIGDEYEGQGLGSQLASAALDAARDAGLAVVPVCEFIAGYVKGHPEYAELVPEDRRASYGL